MKNTAKFQEKNAAAEAELKIPTGPSDSLNQPSSLFAGEVAFQEQIKVSSFFSPNGVNVSGKLPVPGNLFSWV